MIISNVDQRNGTTKVRFRLTDSAGVEHVTQGYRVPHGTDLAAFESEQLAKLNDTMKRSEQRKFIDDVTAGVNPFGTEVYNTRAELLKAVLDVALSSPASEPIVLNGLPYLANVTDAELKALYSQDDAWVADVRTKAQNLIDQKAAIDAYQPVVSV